MADMRIVQGLRGHVEIPEGASFLGSVEIPDGVSILGSIEIPNGVDVRIAFEEIEGGYRLYAANAGQVQSIDLMHGKKGDTGNGIASAALNDDYTLTITFTDGTTYTTPSLRGKQGDPGYTPVRGVDYWTPEDIETMEGYVRAARGHAEDAAQSAEEASESAGAALGSAQAAADASGAAIAAQGAARGYAAEALRHAGTASGQAAQAAGSAGEAAGSAQAASDYADSAEGFAGDADASRAAAVAARGKAEEAQGKAEEAQTGAEGARDTAEEYRDEVVEASEGIAQQTTAERIADEVKRISEGVEALIEVNRSIRWYDELPDEGVEGYTYITPDGVFHYHAGEFIKVSGGDNLNGFGLALDAENRVVLSYVNPEDETDTAEAVMPSDSTGAEIVAELQTINAALYSMIPNGEQEG